MSAIVGIFRLDGRAVEQANLSAMVDTLSHRGPDGSGIWQHGTVGLGHRMLWTTAESLYEQQPLHEPRSALTIVADARIDNREELCALVGLTDRPLQAITESRLILHCYEKWGEQCTERLLGDFAFAIWDGRRQQLFCARDHFGVKPFYYYFSRQVFVFATEQKALFCWPEVPRRLNEMRVADYLHVEDRSATRTFYQDISRLPPSHTLVVAPKASCVHRYWQLDPERELRLRSDREYAETLCDLFTDAVRCRMRCAFPLGAMLSGGMDSSSIACVARNLLAEAGEGSLFTFSGLHDEVPESDERRFIHAVLSQGCYKPYCLNLDDVSPLVDLERVLWHQDEAYRGGNLYAIWSLYGVAQKQGVRVILDGYDGDSAISHGLGLLAELASAGRWAKLAQEIIAYGQRTNTPWGPPLWAWMHRYGIQPALSRHALLNQTARVGRNLLRRRRKRIVTAEPRPYRATPRPEFIRRMRLQEDDEARPAPPCTDREKQYRRLCEPGMALTLETLDKCAGAFSIGVRFPFWDKRLVEFCLAVPPEQKMCRGWTRMIMRRAMDGILPPEVQWRGGKADMHPSFERNLLAYEQTRMEQVILSNPNVLEAYIDLPALRRAYARYVARQATVEEVNAIWRSVSLALWLQHAGLAA
ncbi:MAG: lasso peptide isopeptide bond-forming cyclase [Caldilineaceae bacterium]|nr:lasso peptide isopeptide bond-forming cyclase [Caldilineaceae bacterium]